MPKFKWITDPKTDDLILIVNDKERGRIPNPDEIKMDHGKIGGSAFGLDDIKACFERAAGCTEGTA